MVLDGFPHYVRGSLTLLLSTGLQSLPKGLRKPYVDAASLHAESA